MTLGINLHGIVNPIIAMLHPNIPATLYRSTGQKNVRGTVKPTYAEGELIQVQVQSEGPTTLAHVNKVGQEEVTRKMYLFSDHGLTSRVAGIVRPETRGGDMLRLDDETWWLVLGPVEDFTRAGWECVRATMQVKGPDFSGSDWWTG